MNSIVHKYSLRLCFTPRSSKKDSIQDCSLKVWILKLYNQTVLKRVKMHEYENYLTLTVWFSFFFKK